MQYDPICQLGQVAGGAKRKCECVSSHGSSWPESCFFACLMGRQISISMFHHVLFSRGCLECIYTYACHVAGEKSVEKFNRLKKRYDPLCAHQLTLGRDLIILRDLDLAFMPGFLLYSNPIINLNRYHAQHADLSVCR